MFMKNNENIHEVYLTPFCIHTRICLYLCCFRLNIYSLLHPLDLFVLLLLCGGRLLRRCRHSLSWSWTGSAEALKRSLLSPYMWQGGSSTKSPSLASVDDRGDILLYQYIQWNRGSLGRCRRHPFLFFGIIADNSFRAHAGLSLRPSVIMKIHRWWRISTSMGYEPHAILEP